MSRRSILLALGASVLPCPGAVGRVQVGVCGPVKDFDRAASLGFDYFEPGVAEIATLSDLEFLQFRTKVLKSRIRCTSCNSFIRTLRVVGPDVDSHALQSYLIQSLDRCHQLGTEIVVWGSAGSRNVPEGFPKDRAAGQIKQFLLMAGDLARARRMVIAIEPLTRSESNIINTGAEALQMVQAVNHTNVKMIIDYYHMRLEQESPEILVKAASEIVHLHFANPRGRRWPKLSDDDPKYSRFFDLLTEINYSQGISIEGRGSIESDGAASLAFFRQELRTKRA